jgi:hypothetical protein
METVFFMTIWNFTVIWNNLWPFGIVCGHLYIFFPFWYVWTKKNLATLSRTRNFQKPDLHKGLFTRTTKSFCAVSRTLIHSDLLAGFGSNLVLRHRATARHENHYSCKQTLS